MGGQLVYLRAPITEKEVQDGGDLDNGKGAPRFGLTAMQGWRRSMEDAHLAVTELDENISLYGVFDGHGGRGVSRFAAGKLPGILKEQEAYQKGDYARALEQAFLAVDEKLKEDEGRREVEALDRPDSKAPLMRVPRRVLQRFLGGAHTAGGNSEESADGNGDENQGADADGSAVTDENQPPTPGEGTTGEAEDTEAAGEEDEDEDNGQEDWGEEEMALVDPSRLTRDPCPEAQGCTAVAVLVVRRKDGEGPRLFCANAGDSRAVLSRLGQVVALSEDHKPENSGETARITKAGGFVQQMPGGARVQGDLNLSRAMGDLRYKKPDNMPPEEQILTVFPEVRTFPLTDEDEFMVIGCDGIWERIGNQEVVDLVRPRMAKDSDGKVPVLSSICNDICDRGLCPSMDMSENEGFDGTGCDNMTVMIVQLKKEVSGQPRKRAAEEEKEPAEPAAAGEDGAANAAGAKRLKSENEDVA